MVLEILLRVVISQSGNLTSAAVNMCNIVEDAHAILLLSRAYQVT